MAGEEPAALTGDSVTAIHVSPGGERAPVATTVCGWTEALRLARASAWEACAEAFDGASLRQSSAARCPPSSDELGTVEELLCLAARSAPVAVVHALLLKACVAITPLVVDAASDRVDASPCASSASVAAAVAEAVIKQSPGPGCGVLRRRGKPQARKRGPPEAFHWIQPDASYRRPAALWHLVRSLPERLSVVQLLEFMDSHNPYLHAGLNVAAVVPAGCVTAWDVRAVASDTGAKVAEAVVTGTKAASGLVRDGAATTCTSSRDSHTCTSCVAAPGEAGVPGHVRDAGSVSTPAGSGARGAGAGAGHGAAAGSGPPQVSEPAGPSREEGLVEGAGVGGAAKGGKAGGAMSEHGAGRLQVVFRTELRRAKSMHISTHAASPVGGRYRFSPGRLLCYACGKRGDPEETRAGRLEYCRLAWCVLEVEVQPLDGAPPVEPRDDSAFHITFATMGLVLRPA